MLVEISGADVRAALENGFSMMDSGAGRFPQVSGMVVNVDRRSPRARGRVGDGRRARRSIRRRTYKVGANNFMFGGGDGYKVLAAGKTLIGETDGELISTVGHELYRHRQDDLALGRGAHHHRMIICVSAGRR